MHILIMMLFQHINKGFHSHVITDHHKQPSATVPGVHTQCNILNARHVTHVIIIINKYFVFLHFVNKQYELLYYILRSAQQQVGPQPLLIARFTQRRHNSYFR